MGRPLKIAKNYSEAGITVDEGFPNDLTTNNGFNGDYPGVVGGNNVSLNIVARAKIGSGSEGNAYILRQKGKRKYLVRVGSDIGVCTVVDQDNGSIGDNEMTLTAYDGTSNIRLSTLSNHWGADFSGTKYLLTFFTTAAAGDTSGTPFAKVAVDNND